MNSQCYHGSYGACFYDINELNTTNASFQWWNKKNLKILLVRPTCSFLSELRVNPYFDWMLISGHMVINLIKLCFWTQSSLLKFGNSVTIVRNWKINIHKTHLISYLLNFLNLLKNIMNKTKNMMSLWQWKLVVSPDAEWIIKIRNILTDV